MATKAGSHWLSTLDLPEYGSYKLFIDSLNNLTAQPHAFTDVTDE